MQGDCWRLPLRLVVLIIICCNFLQASDHLRIVTIDTRPFVYQDNNKPGLQLNGYLIDMLKELQSQLNFTYDLYMVPDGKYGTRQPNGSWDGLIYELVKGHADMALAALSVTLSRQRDIDFSIPYLQTGISILYKRPPSGEALPFWTLPDLVHKSNIRFGYIRGGSTDHFFRRSSFQLYQDVGNRLERYHQDYVGSIEEGVERVRKGEYAFVGETSMIEYFLGVPPCDLMRFGDNINTIGYGLGFQMKSKLVEKFNFKLLQMSEDGTMERLYRKHWPQNCVQPKLCVCPATRSRDASDAMRLANDEQFQHQRARGKLTSERDTGGQRSNVAYPTAWQFLPASVLLLLPQLTTMLLAIQLR